MKTAITLGLLTAAALLCGCQKKNEAVDPLAEKLWRTGQIGHKWDTNAITWDYRDLNFRGPFTSISVCDEHGHWLIETNFTTAEALNFVGAWGWRLAWTDGSNCIVERPHGWPDGDFTVNPNSN